MALFNMAVASEDAVESGHKILEILQNLEFFDHSGV
jgi:hypothetical protein